MNVLCENEAPVTIVRKKCNKTSRVRSSGKNSSRKVFEPVNQSIERNTDTSSDTTMSTDEYRAPVITKKKKVTKKATSRKSKNRAASYSSSFEQSRVETTLGFQLRTATIHKKVHEMERLLKKDPCLVNDAAGLGEHGAVESGLTALHIACQLGFDECAGLLIYHKADVNAKTEGGNTPLHFACSEGHASCVEQLINSDAKTHLMDILDQTPKDVAKLACKGEWDVCVSLIEEAEVRFGFKVLKMAAGFVAISIAAFAGYWQWSSSNGVPRVNNAESSGAVEQ
jgi:hypothetical protein